MIFLHALGRALWRVPKIIRQISTAIDVHIKFPRGSIGMGKKFQRFAKDLFIFQIHDSKSWFKFPLVSFVLLSL